MKIVGIYEDKWINLWLKYLIWVHWHKLILYSTSNLCGLYFKENYKNYFNLKMKTNESN